MRLDTITWAILITQRQGHSGSDHKVEFNHQHRAQVRVIERRQERPSRVGSMRKNRI